MALSAKSKYILNHDDSNALGLGYFKDLEGSVWLVSLNSILYKIVDDGTGNEFWHHGKPEEISDEYAVELIWQYAEDESEAESWADQFGLELTL